MKFDGIEAFIATVEAGSITAAARKLRLSKSVVSERLAELERNLGAKLLQRTTRKLSLTEDGSAFHARAACIMHEIENAAADVAERRGTLSGPLRLSAPVTFGRMHLGPALYSFLAKYPEIKLTLDLDDRRVDAAADGYDAVIRHGPIDDTRLVVSRLAPTRRMLVASPAYLARRGTPRTKAELEKHDGIVYANRGGADWRFMSSGGAVIVRAAARTLGQQRRYAPRRGGRRARHRAFADVRSRASDSGGRSQHHRHRDRARGGVHFHGPPPRTARIG